MPEPGAAPALGGAGQGTPPAPTAARGDPIWGDEEAPPREPAVPVLHLDGFDGPLELLLDLAERQRIDLGRFTVLALAEQCVAALARLGDRVPVERRADWLVLAARLVLLRTRLLVPTTPEADGVEAGSADGRQRIADRAFIRAATGWLQARPQLGHDVLARPHPEGCRRSRVRAAVAGSLAAALQLARDGNVSLAQAAPFAPITLHAVTRTMLEGTHRRQNLAPADLG